jgi:UDP-N-acetylmuramoylalanine--D-glutamate ligase
MILFYSEYLDFATKSCRIKSNMIPKSKAFIFRGYKLFINEKKIKFNYRITFSNSKSLDFTETLILPSVPKDITTASLKAFLEPLHLMLGISYYKLYCPKKIELSFKISQEQSEFWIAVYRKGLGEFLYQNKLDPEIIAQFPVSKIKTKPVSIQVRDKSLLGVGGGKDSIVAAELLKENGHEFSSFLVETQRKDLICEEIIKTIGKPSVKIKRIIDPKLFEEHIGSYNGHVPISAIFAFIGLLSAALYKYKFVMVGNEQSSNFGNLKYKGEIINHQWSKSSEFEGMLQSYTRKFITKDITYTSVLRQYHEIRIAKMFAKLKKYHCLFSSCNRSFRVHKERTGTLWCCECPKCAFVYLVLAPFLPKKELISIFGKDLLNESQLIPMYRDLLGLGKAKPFDCVGTFEESRAAMWLVRKTYQNDAVVRALLSSIKDGEELVFRVMKTTQALTLPTPFRFLGIESIGILGYGREGKITHEYLKQQYPKIKIGILDIVRDKNYLAHQDRYDLVVKTPGIQKSKVIVPYTTATNIFFSSIKNPVIGVTGSKGKSTTASLIYEMLKADGRKVRLLGNIGSPMLKALLSKVSSKEIFVLELSSYMLDDIEYSPNVAVLTNLFPEHMDYHEGVDNYYLAKKNIFKYQGASDVAIEPPHKVKIPVKTSNISLIGEHNLRNIKSAIRAVKIFGVSDESITKALKHFKALSHRLQDIGTFKGITFIDDAISTTPESTIEAIKSIKNIGTIFLGGEDRGYDFKKLEKEIRRARIKNVVLFPNTGARIFSSLNGLNVINTRSMEQAVRFAYENTQQGSVCLLSTASPSYSVWKNFEEKGDLFQKFVKKYSK